MVCLTGSSWEDLAGPILIFPHVYLSLSEGEVDITSDLFFSYPRFLFEQEIISRVMENSVQKL